MREKFIRPAFSLMEMMIVLLIVAIIAAASAPMVAKKMMRQTGTGDSPWLFTGTGSNLAFNRNGVPGTTVFIGADAPAGVVNAASPANGSSPLYIRANDPGINLGVAATSGQAITFADNNNRIVGHLGMTEQTTFFSNIIPAEGGGGNDGAVIIGGNLNVTTNGQRGLLFNKTIVGYNMVLDINEQRIANNQDGSQDVLVGSNMRLRLDNPNNPPGGANIVMGNNIDSRRDAIQDSILIGDNIAFGSLNPLNNNLKFGCVLVGNQTGIGNGNINSAVAIGEAAFVGGDEAVAMGRGASAQGAQAISIGRGALSQQQDGIALGGGATAVDAQDIAFGNNARSRGPSAIAIGNGARAETQQQQNAPNSISIGSNANAEGANSIAIGSNTAQEEAIQGINNKFRTRALGNDSIAIGHGAVANGQNAIAIGSGVTANGDNQIVLGNANNILVIPGDIDGTTAENIVTAALGQCDIRLKNVGEKFTSGIDAIKKLEFYNFTYKDDKENKPHVGVMAQDLQKVFPISVSEGSDGYLRIRLDEMFYAALNAIKELDNKIVEIKNKVAAYFNRVEKLEAQIEDQKKAIESQTKTIEELRAQNAEFKKRLAKIEKGVNKRAGAKNNVKHIESEAK